MKRSRILRQRPGRAGRFNPAGRSEADQAHRFRIALLAALNTVVVAVVIAVSTGWLTRLGIIPDLNGPGSPAATGDASIGVPFTVTPIDYDAAQGGCQVWMAPGAPRTLSPVPTADGGWAGWAARDHAVPAGSSGFEFTVQGVSQAQVTITDIRAVVLSREPDLKGTQVLPFDCGGPGARRWIQFDLDPNPPTASDQFDDTGDADPLIADAPVRFPYHVSLQDSETFRVESRALACDCAWVLEISWASRGHTGTLRVTDSTGHPFRTTGLHATRTRCQPDQNGVLACRTPLPADLRAWFEPH